MPLSWAAISLQRARCTKSAEAPKRRGRVNTIRGTLLEGAFFVDRLGTISHRGTAFSCFEAILNDSSDSDRAQSVLGGHSSGEGGGGGLDRGRGGF